jgi:hypothetical protein
LRPSFNQLHELDDAALVVELLLALLLLAALVGERDGLTPRFRNASSRRRPRRVSKE